MTAAVLLWLAAGFRVWRCLQRRHSAELRAIALALIAIACAATLNVPVVAASVDRAVAWPNLADALKQVGIVGAACGNQLMLLRMTQGNTFQPATTRRWLTTAASVSVLSLLLFLAAKPVPELTGDAFAKRYAGAAWLAESRLLVTFYAGVVLFGVARLCRRHWSRDRLGRGIVLLGAGAAVMVIYCALRIGYLGGHRLSYSVPGWVYDCGTLLSKLGLALVAIGTMAPGIEGWIQGRRDLTRIASLNTFLTEQWPQVAERHSRSRLTAIDVRVDDQVTEVQDALGLEAVRRHVDVSDPAPSISAADQAAQVVRWLRQDSRTTLTRAWLDTPAHLTDREWVLALASAFDRTEQTSEAAA